MIPASVVLMGKGADVVAGSRILAERRPAEVRDPRASDPRVLTPAERHYLARSARIRP